MCTNLEQLRVAAGYLFDLVENEQAALIFMYRDEEGDFCTLCDATLPDALSRVAGSVSLRLIIATATPFDNCVPGVEEVQPQLSTREQNERVSSSGLGHIQNACKYFLPPAPITPAPALV